MVGWSRSFLCIFLEEMQWVLVVNRQEIIIKGTSCFAYQKYVGLENCTQIPAVSGAVLVSQLVEHQSRNLVVVGLSPIQDSSVFPFT